MTARQRRVGLLPRTLLAGMLLAAIIPARGDGARFADAKQAAEHHREAVESAVRTIDEAMARGEILPDRLLRIRREIPPLLSWGVIKEDDRMIAVHAGRREGVWGFVIEPGHRVMRESFPTLTSLTLDGIPVGNGILTTEDEAQAIRRADPAQLNKGGGAAEAAGDGFGEIDHCRVRRSIGDGSRRGPALAGATGYVHYAPSPLGSEMLEGFLAKIGGGEKINLELVLPRRSPFAGRTLYGNFGADTRIIDETMNTARKIYRFSPKRERPIRFG